MTHNFAVLATFVAALGMTVALYAENTKIKADLAISQQQTIEARIRLGQCVSYVMKQTEEKGL